MTDLKAKILFHVKDDLKDIEAALAENLNPYYDLVSQVAKHILFSGGKRLRPLLMVLSARSCGYQGTLDKTFSTIFEYLHAATLLHDDLVDEASLRRGKQVANQKWGNSIAVLVGDFLLARSLTIAAKTNKPRVIDIIAGITENMSQGEIYQLSQKGNLELSESDYMEVIRRKTAVLFQGACWTGAIIANAPETRENALSEYGNNLGLAFQMVDDLLDYTSDTTVLGKGVGADLKEGKLTLPVIYALKNASSTDREIMKKIIKQTDFSVQEFENLLELLEKYEGMAYTQKLAAKCISRAKEAISSFPDDMSKELLLDIADYALIRKA